MREGVVERLIRFHAATFMDVVCVNRRNKARNIMEAISDFRLANRRWGVAAARTISTTLSL